MYALLLKLKAFGILRMFLEPTWSCMLLLWVLEGSYNQTLQIGSQSGLIHYGFFRVEDSHAGRKSQMPKTQAQNSGSLTGPLRS